jgi:hypothetical protein
MKKPNWLQCDLENTILSGENTDDPVQTGFCVLVEDELKNFRPDKKICH